MSRIIIAVAVFGSGMTICCHAFAADPGKASFRPPPPQKHVSLLLAVASYRDRAKYPTIYFYEHDGRAKGKIVGSIPTANKRSDSRPSLTLDGRYCAFASEQENKPSKIFFWDRPAKKLINLPKLNESPNAQLHPCLSGDGKLLAFTAWNRPGASLRWDLMFYDVSQKKFLETEGMNTQRFDERMPCLSGNGRYVAFISNANSKRSTDICVHDRKTNNKFSLDEMNSPGFDVDPAMSSDGGLIAFSSDRLGGKGGRDIYLFNRAKSAFVPLPGLNSAAHEQTPSLSADGSFIAFVSERILGKGERDVFLYDRNSQKLLPLPGLNCKREDIDPCIIVLTAERRD